jgi:hypothetical protein
MVQFDQQTNDFATVINKVALYFFVSVDQMPFCQTVFDKKTYNQYWTGIGVNNVAITIGPKLMY